MKLISMTDFVLEQTKEYVKKGSGYIATARFYYIFRTSNYAKFLIQPLKLEMFVPCDDNRNVLDYPVNNGVIESHLKLKEFEKAKEKVLFEGFECIKECDDYLCLTHENITIYYNIEEQIFILDDNDDTVLSYIECLCNDSNYTYRYITLTTNATKKFL